LYDCKWSRLTIRSDAGQLSLAGRAWSAKVRTLAWRRAHAASQKYLSDKDVARAKLANEKPKGETIAYDSMLNACKAGKAR
jgi:hypothetical protein